MNSKSFKGMVAFAALLAVVAGGVLWGAKFFGGASTSDDKKETALTKDKEPGPGVPPAAAAPTNPDPAPEAPKPPVEVAKPQAKAEPTPAPTQDVSKAPSGLVDVRALIGAGKTFEAREALVRLYTDEKASPALRNDIEVEMVKLAEVLYVQKPTDRDFEFYTVQQGDNLIKIANYFKTEKKMAVEFGTIKLFSGLKRDLINVGMRLKIPKGKLSIVVRKSTFKLHVMYEGLIVKTFKVGIGKNDGTPAAKFVVSTKTSSPTWYPPENTGLKGPIPPNDPRNALGSHWIGLDHDQYRGFGIHGTIEPNTIGTQSSLGCVRMLNEEVKLVFELVTPGTEVWIVE
jgi:hypothetical protein